MNINFEPVMAAQFAAMQAAATITFTADAALGNPTLSSVSSTALLFDGLPVFGPGVPRNAVIASIGSGTVTLSAPMTAPGTAVGFTTGFLTTDRRVQHWSKVDAQPALFFRRLGTIDEYDSDNFFGKTTLECEAWIYSQAGKNPDAVPDVALSNLDQLVRSSFAPDGDYGDPRFTLGGLAFWSRIEGQSLYSPGDLGGQGISRLPIRITLP